MEKYVLTPAEKLDAIYQILKESESRRKRAAWLRIFKWWIILAFAYVALTQPWLIVGKITSYIQPIVMEQMKTILSNQKDWILQQAKDLMQESPRPE